MSTPSRWLIKFAMLYLLAGFIIGAVILINKAYLNYLELWYLLPVHIEVIVFGWVIQFTMGTAYWIFPRYLKTGGRGNSTLAGLMVGLLNIGILINIVTYLHYLSQAAVIWGRLFEVAAVVSFVGLHWKRAVSYRS